MVVVVISTELASDRSLRPHATNPSDPGRSTPGPNASSSRTETLGDGTGGSIGPPSDRGGGL